MYTNTRFASVLKGLPRSVVQQVNRDLQADKYNKGFDFWDHLVAMIYHQLSGCRSLRELESTFNEQSSHHYHLGTHLIKRSTLADANRRRSVEPFAEITRLLMAGVHRQLRRELRQLLYLIDSTPIPLVGSCFESWNQQHRTRTLVGMKIHLQYELNSALPVFAKVTHANRQDLNEVDAIELQENATYIVDKGYCSYIWWHQINEAGAVFVTRLKKNARIQVDQSHPIADEDRSLILADDTIQLTNKHPGGGRLNPYVGQPLRRVIVHREDKHTPLVIVSNDFERSARELADLYRARWAIELFFKWLKQNLKIKRFLGTTENAVKIQLYTAMIAYLLLAIYKARHQIDQPMYQFLAVIRVSLFNRPETEHYRYRQRLRLRQTLGKAQQELGL